MASADVAWAIIRNNSAFILKKRYNGLVNTKAVGVTPGPNNKGFVLTTKKVKAANRPGKTLVKVTMKAGSRRSLHKMKNTLVKQRYRKDLTKAAMLRAAAICSAVLQEIIKLTDPRSQKPLPKMKGPKAVPAAKKE